MALPHQAYHKQAPRFRIQIHTKHSDPRSSSRLASWQRRLKKKQDDTSDNCLILLFSAGLPASALSVLMFSHHASFFSALLASACSKAPQRWLFTMLVVRGRNKKRSRLEQPQVESIGRGKSNIGNNTIIREVR